MEALGNFEDKLKLTTGKAILLLACATFALVVLCILIILKRKARQNKIVHQEAALDEDDETNLAGCPEPRSGWMSVKRAVQIGPTRWCRASKWEENSIGLQKGRKSSRVGLEKQGLEMEWQSHNSVSPVWQRPILMGEKCELPRFSGLILYDDEGKLLPDSKNETLNQVIN